MSLELLRQRSTRWRPYLGLISTSGLLFASCVSYSGAPAPSAAGKTPRSASAEVARQPAAEVSRIALPGKTYDITFDGRRNSLWFSVMSTRDDDALYRLELGSHRVSRWAIPETDHNGYLERVAVAPDGAVWLTEEYSIVRFDPSAEKMTHLTFDENDADAAPDALSPDNPSPGTWPSDIAFDAAGRALVVRHNVGSLVVLDGELKTVDRIRVPEWIRGPGSIADADGQILVASYDGVSPLGVIGNDGESATKGAGGVARLVSGRTSLIGLGPQGIVGLDEAGNSNWTIDTDGSPQNRAAATASGFVVYLRGSATLEWIGFGGQIGRIVDLPSETVDITNPLGEVQTVSAPTEISAVVVDGADNAWFVDATAGDLVETSSGG
jgi:PAS domain-containing protein